MTGLRQLRQVRSAIASAAARRCIAASSYWRKAPGRKGAVIFAPSEEGSLGDEAILQSCIHGIRAADPSRNIGLVAFGKAGQWRRVEGVDSYLDLPSLLDGGSAREWLFLGRFLQEYQQAIIPGTDVLDGFYSERRTAQRLEIAGFAKRLGLDTRVVGFSINATPSLDSMKRFAGISRGITLTCRDRVSMQRLSSFSGRNAELTADLAFLLVPEEESRLSESVIDWIESRKLQGRTVIGINVNEHLVKGGTDEDREKLLRSVATTFEKLIESASLSCVFIPHDRRPEHDDRETAREILRLLGPVAVDELLVLDGDCAAAEVKGIVGHCDAVITGRMHVAIAALGRGVPTACLTYQGKFEGLFEHFGLSGCILTPSCAADVSTFETFVRGHLTNRPQLREQIERALPKVRELALANFRNAKFA